jgi:hypothetical protein
MAIVVGEESWKKGRGRFNKIKQGTRRSHKGDLNMKRAVCGKVMWDICQNYKMKATK